MSINSNQLDAFFACAQLQHFTKAAERLHITQSALSQRIQNLESELGITLLIRDKRSFRLTAAGEILLRHCVGRESSEKELLDRLKRSDTNLEGAIRIGAISSVSRSVVLPALQPLLEANPNIALRLYTREEYELPKLLRSGEIDLMISSEQKLDDSIVSTHLGDEKNVLIQHKEYSGDDIFLDHDENDQTTKNYFKLTSAATLQRRFFDDVYGIIDAVRAKIGKAVVPLHLARNYREIKVLKPRNILRVPIYLSYFEQPYFTQLQREIFAKLQESCRHHLH